MVTRPETISSISCATIVYSSESLFSWIFEGTSLKCEHFFLLFHIIWKLNISGYGLQVQNKQWWRCHLGLWKKLWWPFFPQMSTKRLIIKETFKLVKISMSCRTSYIVNSVDLIPDKSASSLWCINSSLIKKHSCSLIRSIGLNNQRYQSDG